MATQPNDLHLWYRPPIYPSIVNDVRVTNTLANVIVNCKRADYHMIYLKDKRGHKIFVGE